MYSARAAGGSPLAVDAAPSRKAQRAAGCAPCAAARDDACMHAPASCDMHAAGRCITPRAREWKPVSGLFGPGVAAMTQHCYLWTWWVVVCVGVSAWGGGGDTGAGAPGLLRHQPRGPTGRPHRLSRRGPAAWGGLLLPGGRGGGARLPPAQVTFQRDAQRGLRCGSTVLACAW